MDDQNETYPVVPHNSEVDCRPSGSPPGTTGFSRRDRRSDISFWQTQPAKSSTSNGRAAIDSLRSRLYDRPENSEVYRAIIRPVPPSLAQSTQVRNFFPITERCWTELYTKFSASFRLRRFQADKYPNVRKFPENFSRGSLNDS